MLIYIPYANYNRSIKCFDNSILSKQIVIINQVISYNMKIYNGYAIPDQIKNHLDTSFWKGNEIYLLFYLEALLNEFKKRFNREHHMQYNLNFLKQHAHCFGNNTDFFTSDLINQSRKELKNKDKKHYRKYF